jgi:hypothetical protein
MGAIDPYSIITSGIVRENPNSIAVDGIGYFVYIEEIVDPIDPPIVVPIPQTGGIFDTPPDVIEKKYYTLRVTFTDGSPTFTKTIEFNRSDVKITNVKLDKLTNTINIQITNIFNTDLTEWVYVSL